MIYVEPHGGLCNRMRVIASTVNIAAKYDVEVQLIWRLNKACNCHLNELFLPISGVGGVFETSFRISITCEKKRLSSQQFINCDDKAMDNIESAIRDGKDIYISTPHRLGDVDGYKIFSPQPELLHQANELLNEKNDIIGIHMRRTDNIKSIDNSPTEMFINCMRLELDKDPNVKFFVATDSEIDRQVVIEAFPRKIITQKNIELSRKSSEGIKYALVDLICLSRCKMILGSYWSSFSETAAVWNEKKELRTIKR